MRIARRHHHHRKPWADARVKNGPVLVGAHHMNYLFTLLGLHQLLGRRSRVLFATRNNFDDGVDASP